MSANDKQIGGRHYKERKIQHWDYAAQLPYLEGLATKYIDRHRRKGGKEDLLKAIHTIEKMIEEYYPESKLTPAEISLGLGAEPTSSPASPSTGVPYGVVPAPPASAPPAAPAAGTAHSALCPHHSTGQHQYSHVYKHDKTGRMYEIRKCDLCGVEAPRDTLA